MSIILRHLPLLGNKKIFFKDPDLFEVSLRKPMSLSSVFSRGKEFGFVRCQLANSNGLMTGKRLRTEEQMHVLAASTEQPSLLQSPSFAHSGAEESPCFQTLISVFFDCLCHPSICFFVLVVQMFLSRSLPSAPSPRSK